MENFLLWLKHSGDCAHEEVALETSAEPVTARQEHILYKVHDFFTKILPNTTVELSLLCTTQPGLMAPFDRLRVPLICTFGSPIESFRISESGSCFRREWRRLGGVTWEVLGNEPPVQKSVVLVFQRFKFEDEPVICTYKYAVSSSAENTTKITRSNCIKVV
jgi:hypothetical protein